MSRSPAAPAHSTWPSNRPPRWMRSGNGSVRWAARASRSCRSGSSPSSTSPRKASVKCHASVPVQRMPSAPGRLCSGATARPSSASAESGGRTATKSLMRLMGRVSHRRSVGHRRTAARARSATAPRRRRTPAGSRCPTPTSAAARTDRSPATVSAPRHTNGRPVSPGRAMPRRRSSQAAAASCSRGTKPHVRVARSQVDLEPQAADAGQDQADAERGDHRDQAADREADPGAVGVGDPADEGAADRRAARRRPS